VNDLVVYIPAALTTIKTVVELYRMSQLQTAGPGIAVSEGRASPPESIAFGGAAMLWNRGIDAVPWTWT
jgi:hypothetical protein